jgi:hypothetical protein
MTRKTRHEWMGWTFTWNPATRGIQRSPKLYGMDVMHPESDLIVSHVVPCLTNLTGGCPSPAEPPPPVMVLEPLASLTAEPETTFEDEEELGAREELDEDADGRDELDDPDGLDDEEDTGGLDDEEEDPEGLDEELPAAAAAFAFSLSRSFKACCRACSEEEEDDPELDVRDAEDDEPEGALEDEEDLTVGGSGSGLALSSWLSIWSEKKRRSTKPNVLFTIHQSPVTNWKFGELADWRQTYTG